MPALRASSRLKVRQTQTTEPETAPKPSREHPNDTEPPRKMQKTTGTNTKAKAAVTHSKGRGKGKKKQEMLLSDLPLDVLFEIFERLQSLDLLNLSYTAKELRSILTAEYATSIWKRAYINVTPTDYGTLPPECPSDVDIRHYTGVVFGRNCLFCAGPDGTIVHSSTLTRLCNACARNELTCSNPTPSKHTAVSEMDSDISKLCWQSLISNDVLKYGNYFLKRDYERHASALLQCVNNEAKARYKAMRMVKIAENANFHRMLNGWFIALVQQKVEKLESLREERLDSIEMKLKEEGYTNFRGHYCDLEELPGANKAASLTDKEWIRIKTKLIHALELHLQGYKEERMKTAFTERLLHLSDLVKRFLKNQPKPWVHAPIPSIAKLEPFASVIRDTDRDETILLVQTRLSQLAHHIPALLTTWRAEADEFLLGLLSGDRKRTTRAAGEDFDRTALELATTFFKCHRCIDPISYPRILMHKCLRACTKLDAPSDEEPLGKVYGVPIVTAKHVWNRMSSWYGPTWSEMCNSISIDAAATRSAAAIVRACGEDPKVFTAAAMNERNVRLECMRCVPRGGRAGVARSRHIMSWNMAILHDISEHPNDISTQGWSLVTTEDDLARAKEFEDKILRSSKQKSWEHCRYCDASVRDSWRTFGAENHLFQVHGIRESGVRGVEKPCLCVGGCTIGCVPMRRQDLKQDDYMDSVLRTTK